MSATICPMNPPGHDWRNGLVCRCGATRTAGEAIVSGLASRRGGSEESARALLDAFTAGLLHDAAEVAAEIHKKCDRTVCSRCEVRRDILDVLTSVADAIGHTDATKAGEGQ